MTDNFQLYRRFIKQFGDLPDTNEKGNLDKYYVIELMRRGKDNPDLSAANYHFKNYYIYSMRDLDRYEEEIKEICTMFRMRAYCSVNFKLMSQVALDTLAESARRLAAHDYKKFYNIFESCSGKFFDKSNALWIVDIDDIEQKKASQASYEADVVNLINSMRSGHSENVVYRFPSKSGLHLITHPFDLMTFNMTYEKQYNDDCPDIKQNHLTLLFENL